MKCVENSLPSASGRDSRGAFYLRHSPKGSALVIILSAVVLVSILVILFVSQATLNRQISFSSAGQYRADTIAFTAMDTVVGDLRSEIIAGSTTTTIGGISIYQPTNNFTAVPLRVSDDGFTNVVKRSAGGQSFWSGTNYSPALATITRAATNNNTASLSANGRSFQPARWNAPYLLGPTLPATFTAPDWIVITRRGAITNSANMPPITDLANSNPSNSSYAIGRFAYMIYNEGGLLDINVAGFPNTATASFKSKRGLLPQIDLGKIPGVANADAIVKWRNANTISLYEQNVLANTNGFTAVASGDRTFLSRQDLIKYVKQHPTEIVPEALQYLATFTRELNAPSVTPDPKNVNSGFPASGEEEEINPSLINTRVVKEFTRRDGSTAKIGEPLIKTRFPLSALSAFTRTAYWDTSSANYKYFGLSRSSLSSPWEYRGGNANRILNLDEVAEEGREPDFLELLQAGIAIGSLGMSAGDWTSQIKSLDQNYSRQVAQIAANLIDQYDTDAWPTRITFGSETLSGIENLPYLSRIIEQPYRASANGSGTGFLPNGFSENVGIWYRPEIWNPHAYSQAATTNASGPTEFRYWVEGKAYLEMFTLSSGGGYPSMGKSDLTDLSASPGITFSNGSIFNQPTLLDYAPNVTATGNDRMTDGSKTFIGIFVGSLTAKDQRLFTGATGLFIRALATPDDYVDHHLQYKSNGVWITYDTIRRHVKGAATVDNYGNPDAAQVTQTWQNITHNPAQGFSGSPFLLRSDPRTDRFGANISADTYAYGNTFRIAGANGNFVHGLTPTQGWTFGGTYIGDSAMYPGLLSDNKTDSLTHYTDPDGTVRRGDSANANNYVSFGGLPVAQDPQYSKPKSRPLILNRPFRSVAEMGYASRDMPWKHLDFFTSESGDTALLDLFCINPPPKSGVRAGVIDLNTRQPSVLAAALSGAVRREEPGGSPSEVADATGPILTDADAAALSASLISLTTDTSTDHGPLLSRGDLVSRWLGDTDFVPIGEGVTTLDDRIKRRREAPIRALSDIGSTRTWNLLIDIVAQSGKYSATSTNLNQFIVEGERRYWWHIALDRYTGKIVDQYLETVIE